MFRRLCAFTAVMAGLAFITGCSASQVDTISVSPATQSLAVSQTAQLTATGTTTHGKHPATTADLTSVVAWSSSAPSVATINSSGLVTAVSAGTATINASMKGFSGMISSSATITVTSSGSGGGTGGSGGGSGGSGGGGTGGNGSPQEPLISIQIVPGDVTVSNKGMTAQYLAFGTFSTAPTVRDITNSVTWISTLPEVASINSCGSSAAANCGSGAAGAPSGGVPGEFAGLATAQGYTGKSNIYAMDTTSNPDGTVVLSNSQSFSCSDANTQTCQQLVPKPQFATITVYIAGAQTAPAGSGESVTAPSDTGTPNLIHCGKDYSGSGGQVCTGTYEVGSPVTLTENLPAGSPYFGGWSTGSGCIDPNNNNAPLTASQLATSQTCTISVNGQPGLNGNASVGVIFY